ncbi:MAG: hypothetical protein C0424_06260 [Sphingobacteriaceae bacterium]|nr:hypothetical protein [Sphingobacteriaceae bacterium]
MDALSLTAGEVQPALHQFIDALKHHPYLIALNSNDKRDGLPPHYHHFDWMVAASSHAHLEATAVGDSFDQLKASRQGKKWQFGFLTYDLKNELESLTSGHPDGVAFPAMAFFEPEWLFVCQNGRIECLLQADDTDWQSWLSAETQPTIALPKLTFSRHVNDADYLQTIEGIREHIAAGTVYELNYCMEWSTEVHNLAGPVVYRALNQKTQAPFSTYLQWKNRWLVGGSPERFLRKAGNELISQPIKGTIRRAADAVVDEQLRQKLASDEKEKAENIMIVDLVRNDLSRSCKAGSVQVPALQQVYAFATVHQMISTVRGEMKDASQGIEAIAAAFPMGSMTGAPKIKAMELIEALEKSKRGLYSGTIGYFTPDDNFDFNVVIRSLQYNTETGYLSLMTGSAITYDSVPEQELAECELKAAALLGLFA